MNFRFFQILMAMLFIAAHAWAQNFTGGTSFLTTNTIASATAYTDYPTNIVGTNGICLGSGVPIEVRNYDKGGLTVYFQPTVTNGGNFQFQLIRANSPNVPQVTGTNYGPGQFDWETSPVYTITITNNASTNTVVYHTNLGIDCIGFTTTHVAVHQLTNTANSGSFTNVAILWGKKIIPIRYP